MICPVCRDTKLVRAVEVPEAANKRTRHWQCEGLNGKARCNRPKVVTVAWSKKYGEVRVGMADCPLCAARRITKTRTEDLSSGAVIPDGMAEWEGA